MVLNAASQFSITLLESIIPASSFSGLIYFYWFRYYWKIWEFWKV